jgi:hypothetical protein
MQSYEKNDPNRARLVVDDQGQEITNEENQETDQRGPGRFAEQGSKEKRKANNGKECELPEDKKQQCRGPLVKLRADESGTCRSDHMKQEEEDEPRPSNIRFFH